MTIETVYVAHHSGAVLSSHHLPPWVADDLAQATHKVWHGQPVFRDRATAFAWLDWALNDRFRLLDMSVAEVRADTYVRPGDVVRARLDRTALLDPAAQIARGTPQAERPHPSVLASWYSTTRAAGGTRWVGAAPRAASPDAWIGDVARTVWNHAYPLASRDARTTVAACVADAAAAALHAEPSGNAHAGLARLHTIADQIGTAGIPTTVPDIATRTVAAATEAAREEADGRGWQRVVDRVWTDALNIAALDSVLATAADIHIAWRAVRAADEHARGGTRDLPAWIRATLVDANRTVAQQWRDAASTTPPPSAHNARGTARSGQLAPHELVPARGHARGSSTEPPAADEHVRTARAFMPLGTVRPTESTASRPAAPPDSTTPHRGRSR